MEPIDDSSPLKERPKNLAEALQFWRLMGGDNRAPSPTAVRLAAVLAERLDAIVPAPFRVRAEGGWVSGSIGDRLDFVADVAFFLDRDPSAARDAGSESEESSFVDRVLSITDHVLGSVQDMIAEDTTEPWPLLRQGGMAIPGTRADAERVYLWFGPDSQHEDAAVLSLPPIELAALERGQ